MIGRTIQVGIGKETTRGTSVVPSYWLPTLAPSTIEDKKQYEDDMQSFGNISDSDGSVIIKEWAEGEINGKVRDRSFGLLLLSAFGSVSSAQKGGDATVYDHTFTIANSNQHQALTFARKDAYEQFRFALGMVASLKISAEIGKFVTYALSLKAKKGASASDSPSYLSTENEFTAKHCTFKTASNLAGLGAASSIPIRKVDISISKALEEIISMGSTEPTDFQNTELSVEINIEAEYSAIADFKTPFLAGTKKAMQINIVDTTTTIGSSSNPGLVFDFPKVSIQSWERSGGQKDIIRQSIRGKAHYSLSDAMMIRAILTNLVTSY